MYKFTPEGRKAFLETIAVDRMLACAEEIEHVIEAMESDVSNYPPPMSGSFIRTVPYLNGRSIVLSVDWFVKVVHPEPLTPLAPPAPVMSVNGELPRALPEWGPADQRALDSLLARKAAHDARKRSENRDKLIECAEDVVGEPCPEALIDKLIAGADKLIAALQPFVKGEEKA